MTEYNGQVYVDKYYLVFDMPVTKGVSGSPVFSKDDEEYKIVAIHAKDIKPLIKNFKASLRLTNEIFEYMNKNFTQLCYKWDCGKF